MSLQFQPPPDWLLQNYLSRPSPGQEASQAIGAGIQSYAQGKAAKQQQQQAALKQYVDAFGVGGPDLAGQVAKRLGLENPPALPGTTAVQVPSGGTAGVSYAPGTPSVSPGGAPPPVSSPQSYDVNGSTPTEVSAQQSMPSEHPADAPPQISPIVQASLAAGHPNHAGLTLPGNPDPLTLANQGSYGAKQLGVLESVQKLQDAQTSAADKAEENGPKSFDYAKAIATAAGDAKAADPFITLASKEGRSTLNKREIDDLKNAITSSAQKSRGEFYSTMGNVREQQLRDSLIKEARTTLDPYFQTGPGKQQAQKLNAILGAKALIDQVSAQPGGADSRQMTEVATAVAKVLASGGANAQAQIEHLIPQTYKGNANKFIESLTNNPTGLDQQAFVNRYGETLDRESKTIKAQLRDTAERSASTLRVLKSQYPEDYNAIIDQYLSHSPEIFGENPGTERQVPISASGSTNGWSYVGKAQ